MGCPFEWHMSMLADGAGGRTSGSQFVRIFLRDIIGRGGRQTAEPNPLPPCLFVRIIIFFIVRNVVFFA